MKVIKIGAIWCNACLVMKPRWKKLEEKLSWLDTEYYDADEDPRILDQRGVKDIPCFIFLDKNGKEIKRLNGEIEEKELEAVLLELKEK